MTYYGEGAEWHFKLEHIATLEVLAALAPGPEEIGDKTDIENLAQSFILRRRYSSKRSPRRCASSPEKEK